VKSQALHSLRNEFERRWLPLRLLRLSLALVLGLSLTAGCRHPANSNAPTGLRLVTLSPDMTETLFEIGAGPAVIAVSDYCDTPSEVLKLPRVGTSITPNYEAITRLRPSLIVSEANVAARRRELEALGPTRLLPWLTLPEIANSVRELGRITSRRPAADALAAKLESRLGVPAPANGPRVLMVLGGEGGDSADIWFVRDNSLHGAVLRAAGARNAVPEAVNGPPRLSHERLLALDPDAILVLSKPKPGAAPKPTGFEAFSTLKAVQQHRVARIETDEAFANGPRILPLVDRVQRELSRLGLGG
jgi:ABC-type Fe3+-hydroxamate transport system substrate-binding protein